jgi:cephalosporin hydroxylase
MSEVASFFSEVRANVDALKADKDLQALSRMWIRAIGPYRYVYNFTWWGRPIIQHPQDVMAMQELVFQIKPDVIIETGVAHGGSLIFHASMLELLGGERFVIGIDIDIRAHNRAEIEAHPMMKRIRLIAGSSIDPAVVRGVREAAAGKRVLLCLDSNHTHEHVLAELRAYAPLVPKGSYAVVFDTLIEDLPASFSTGRPWGPGNNPKTAVNAYLEECSRFVADDDIDAKLLISVAPKGYLRCVQD